MTVPAVSRPVPSRPAVDADAVVAALYRDHGGTLLTFVLRLTGGDRPWAEDVVQETMIRAWRSAARLDPAASPMPWLATVARRIVIDDRRRRAVRPAESGDTPLEQFAAREAAQELDALLGRVVLDEALASLSAAHRSILTETVVRDRTVNQAAAALGIPVGTAKSRVYYALRALRAALEDRGWRSAG
ncbi:sigma-70 family RNA polymerase sigma factor [Actinomadura flavalba]|uniref:sigma-70 family RNA polymerase sigma factor n=1 Tax=Actinomadura flavalba TaxID=1120938 RepID=UPI000370E104|nr:sigma-70 family RNA polymerase sigma factor [Actinomadura flavalba]